MTLLAKVARHPPADLLLATEALLLLAFFRLCLSLVPVRRIIQTLTRGPSRTPAPLDSSSIAPRVRWAIGAVARHSAVEFVCFPQTLAGYTMLRRRHIPSTMVYGVARSLEGALLAHTWLIVGGRTILGGEVAGDFTPVEQWT